MEYRIFVTLNFENCLFTKMTCDNGKIKFQFQINCAGCRLHVYRNTWSPKIGQNLVVRQEVRNDCNPFAMPVEANISGKLTNFDIVGHIPQKISLFCHYFVNYWGFIEARVQESKYRPSPIPNGGLESPITLVIKKGHSTREVFEKMESGVDANNSPRKQVESENSHKIQIIKDTSN